jgi:hypothetical protein
LPPGAHGNENRRVEPLIGSRGTLAALVVCTAAEQPR